jgi:hypothetical protein
VVYWYIGSDFIFLEFRKKVPFQGEIPSALTEPYKSHLLCSHDRLKPDTSQLTKIPFAVFQLLKKDHAELPKFKADNPDDSCPFCLVEESEMKVSKDELHHIYDQKVFLFYVDSRMN